MHGWSLMCLKILQGMDSVASAAYIGAWKCISGWQPDIFELIGNSRGGLNWDWKCTSGQIILLSVHRSTYLCHFLSSWTNINSIWWASSWCGAKHMKLKILYDDWCTYTVPSWLKIYLRLWGLAMSISWVAAKSLALMGPGIGWLWDSALTGGASQLIKDLFSWLFHVLVSK